MTDTVTPETRSRMMSGICAKNTKPEKMVRSALFAAGYRFRIHRKDLPGSPDIVLPGKKVAIFVHGCFWHCHKGCNLAKLPSSNPEFWRNKLDGNVERDRSAIEELNLLGWRVMTVWECATRDRELAPELGHQIGKWMEGSERVGEIPNLLSMSSGSPE